MSSKSRRVRLPLPVLGAFAVAALDGPLDLGCRPLQAGAHVAFVVNHQVHRPWRMLDDLAATA